MKKKTILPECLGTIQQLYKIDVRANQITGTGVGGLGLGLKVVLPAWPLGVRAKKGGCVCALRSHLRASVLAPVSLKSIHST